MLVARIVVSTAALALSCAGAADIVAKKCCEALVLKGDQTGNTIRVSPGYLPARWREATSICAKGRPKFDCPSEFGVRSDGDGWWIGSMTDENARNLELRLDFLDNGRKYVAWVYCDGPDADYETNPYSMTTNRVEVDATTVLTLRLARSGGCAIRIQPQ